MLNNAAFCRMPLLPNNIPISDSGFDNVNAFNTVTPHSHQTGENSRVGEARTYSIHKFGQRQNHIDRLVPNHSAYIERQRHAKILTETYTDRYMQTYKLDKKEVQKSRAFDLFFYLLVHTI